MRWLRSAQLKRHVGRRTQGYQEASCVVKELNHLFLQGPMLERQGGECVYWEKAIIVHAELDEVRLNEWGVKLKFHDLYTPGFTGDARPEAEDPYWTVSASWEVFSYSKTSWSAAYSGWSVYFDPQFIATLREVAQGVAVADGLVRYQALVNCFRDRSSH